MSVISDLGGTSSNSFSINGKNTIFQGDAEPLSILGKDGDVYLQTAGLVYVKRNGNWYEISKDSVPSPSDYKGSLLYSDGNGYNFTEIKYHDGDDNNPNQLELFEIPAMDISESSKIVPSIGWINDHTNGLIHKMYDEVKNGKLSLRNNGTLNTTTISKREYAFLDEEDTQSGMLNNIINSIDGINVSKNSSVTEMVASNTTNNAKVRIILKDDGTKYATAPTPTDTAKDNEIVTAEWIISNVLEKIYPVGSIYLTITDDNPHNILGIGSWERIDSGYCLWTGNGFTRNTEITIPNSLYNKAPANTKIEPGLPNIEGTFTQYDIGSIGRNAYPPYFNGEGAFFQTKSNNIPTKYGTFHNVRENITEYSPKVIFNAHDSNSIYGKSDTVQPPAFVVNVWKRVS